MPIYAHDFYLLQNICRIFGFGYEHTLKYDLNRSNTYQFRRKDDVKHLLRTQFSIIDVIITSLKAVMSVKATTSSLVFCIINQCTGVPDCSFNHPEVYAYGIDSQLPVIRPSDGFINSRLHSHVLKVFDTYCAKTLLYPLGTLRPLYRTGISLFSRELLYIFNQQIYFII